MWHCTFDQIIINTSTCLFTHWQSNSTGRAKKCDKTANNDQAEAATSSNSDRWKRSRNQHYRKTLSISETLKLPSNLREFVPSRDKAVNALSLSFWSNTSTLGRTRWKRRQCRAHKSQEGRILQERAQPLSATAATAKSAWMRHHGIPENVETSWSMN